MAGSQHGLFTPEGKTVSLNDISAILEFVDSGKPFQIHVTSRPIENGQKRVQLHIRNCVEACGDTTKIDSNNAEHASGYYDSRALVKQLKSLQLTDMGTVEQILTSAQPAALSELTAAHNTKSIIPLVTAKDGRVFSILAGQLAYSNWAGRYPMEFAQEPIRKLGDPALAASRITAYQNDVLMKILRAVSHTKESCEFRKPMCLLRPKLWNQYKMMIVEPVDLDSMHTMLFHKRYETMADFRRHVDLLQQNSETYNVDRNTWVIEAAAKVRSDIYRRMHETPAEPPVDEEVMTQVRRVISVDADGRGTTGGPDTGDESEDSSRGEATGSEPQAGDTDERVLVLPLGRLCVQRNAGDNEVIVTPYIVTMDLESAFKALWLVKDLYTPVGLPNDKTTLLEFGGRYNFTAGKLADDIDDWKLRRTKVPVLSWASVEKLIRQSSNDSLVLFDRVGTQQETAVAIGKGWNESIESEEDFVDEELEDERDGDYNER